MLAYVMVGQIVSSKDPFLFEKEFITFYFLKWLLLLVTFFFSFMLITDTLYSLFTIVAT